jgi:ferredoxin, 2Fe-2S
MPIATTYAVRVVPAEIELAVEADEPLIRAAWRAGYYWPTVCGGNGECLACACDVIEGQDAVLPPSRRETMILMGRSRAGSRLACQLRVKGPATVEKKGVRRTDSS